MAVQQGQGVPKPDPTSGIFTNAIMAPTLASGPVPMAPAGASSFGNPYGNLPSFPNTPNGTVNSGTGINSQAQQSFGNPYGNLPSAAPTSTTGNSNIVTQALGQNLSGAPDLTSLTNLINQLNLTGQQAANAGRIPNDPALESASSANIGSELGGNLPYDVVTQLTQQAAERGIATGSPGSDASNSALLRALGLSSLDMTQLGQTNLTAADARNPVAPIFNPGSLLLTPAQLGSLNNSAANTSLNWLNSVLGSGLGQPQQGTNYGQGPGVPVNLGGTTTTDPTSNWWSGITGGTPSSASTAPGSIGTVNPVYDPTTNPETGEPFATSTYDPFSSYYDTGE